MNNPIKGQNPLTILGIVFGLLSAIYCISAFWAMGRDVRDALVLTAYEVNLSPGQKHTFGYGGESSEEQVTVPFQGREMSNVAFTIERPSEEEMKITGGRYDRIRVGRTWYEPGQAAPLNDRDKIETRGWLGRAGFQVFLNKKNNKLLLQLNTPIFLELSTGQTRVVFGTRFEPALTSKDEIFFRTLPGVNTKGESFNVVVRDSVLYARKESDVPEQAGAAPLELRRGDTWPYNNLVIAFNHYEGVGTFGIRLTAALAILCLVLLLGPQIHWPDEPLIFGCVALLVSFGVCLSAYSYLSGAHNPYFPKYLELFYYSFLLLFWLRVPLGPRVTLTDVGGVARLCLAGLGFVLIYALTTRPFSPYNSLWDAFGSLGFAALLFAGVGCVALLLTELFQGSLRMLADSSWPFGRFLGVGLIALSPLVLTGLTAALGGREAVQLTSDFRIHLPTLMLPLMTGLTAVLITAARTQKANRRVILPLALIILGLDLAVYWWVSSDNGGTAAIATGILSACWFSWRDWLLPVILAAVILVAITVGAYIDKPERFDLSVGGAQALQYFDQARNLRLARDMSRAGGWFGFGQDLTIPSGLRSNLHNDLVAAYIVGYFGWVGLFLVLAAYILLYDGLWRGLFTILQGYSDNERDNPTVQVSMRQLLVTFSLSLLLVAVIQTLWMLVTPLQSMIPITGLDLQPISASRISVLSFVVYLLGSVALAQTSHKTLSP